MMDQLVCRRGRHAELFERLTRSMTLLSYIAGSAPMTASMKTLSESSDRAIGPIVDSIPS